MAIDTKDILGWLITGGLGGAGLILSLLTRRDTKRKAKREAESIWSLGPAHGAARSATGHLFSLRLADPAINRYRLSDMQAVEPKGILLAKPSRKPGRDVNAGEIPDNFTDRLVFDRDLDPGLRINWIRREADKSDYAVLTFFADWPSATDRKNRSRLVVKINVEEISSSRRASRLKVSSQPIDWIVRAPASEK